MECQVHNYQIFIIIIIVENPMHVKDWKMGNFYDIFTRYEGKVLD